MANKLRVGVVFGGRSGEHEVSLVSATSVMAALDRNKYEVVPIGITRQGSWLTGGNPLAQLQAIAAKKQEEPLLPSTSLIPGIGADGFPALDIAFPVLHGPYGEDGTIQGLFEMANLAYVGAGVLGSALAMDKIASKQVMEAESLPVVDYIAVEAEHWAHDPLQVIGDVEDRLGYPCFVKPANLGSSVGITKAHDRAELQVALNLAADYDRRMLVERGIDAREIEVSVLGNDSPESSVAGEIVPSREFYDYEAKYVDEDSRLLIPAPLPNDVAEEIRALALRAYRAHDIAGMARIDFLLDRNTERPYLNELNTIPGFTPISMYPKLWEASGLPYPRLLDRLIELGLERFTVRQRSRVRR